MSDTVSLGKASNSLKNEHTSSVGNYPIKCVLCNYLAYEIVDIINHSITSHSFEEVESSKGKIARFEGSSGDSLQDEIVSYPLKTQNFWSTELITHLLDMCESKVNHLENKSNLERKIIIWDHIFNRLTKGIPGTSTATMREKFNKMVTDFHQFKSIKKKSRTPMCVDLSQLPSPSYFDGPAESLAVALISLKGNFANAYMCDDDHREITISEVQEYVDNKDDVELNLDESMEFDVGEKVGQKLDSNMNKLLRMLRTFERREMLEEDRELKQELKDNEREQREEKMFEMQMEMMESFKQFVEEIKLKDSSNSDMESKSTKRIKLTR